MHVWISDLEVRWVAYPKILTSSFIPVATENPENFNPFPTREEAKEEGGENRKKKEIIRILTLKFTNNYSLEIQFQLRF